MVNSSASIGNSDKSNSIKTFVPLSELNTSSFWHVAFAQDHERDGQSFSGILLFNQY